MSTASETDSSGSSGVPRTVVVRPIPAPYAQLGFDENDQLSTVLVGHSRFMTRRIAECQPVDVDEILSMDTISSSGWSTGSDSSSEGGDDSWLPERFENEPVVWSDWWDGEHDLVSRALLGEEVSAVMSEDEPNRCCMMSVANSIQPIILSLRPSRVRSRLATPAKEAAKPTVRLHKYTTLKL